MSGDTKAELLAKELMAKKAKQGLEKKVNPLAAFNKNVKVTEEAQSKIKEDSKDPNKVVLIKTADIGPLFVNGEVMHNRSAMANKDKQELKNFADSLKVTKEGTLYNSGLLQAITVRKSSTMAGKYELIAGFRRNEAFKLNNEELIPAIIIDCDDKTSRRLRNAENKQRRAVNAYDETYGELEEIQLYCEYSSLHEAELKIKKIKKILEERNKLNKKFVGDDNKLKEYIKSSSKFTEEEQKEADELQVAVFEITQKQLPTFVNRLDILKINDLIKSEMINNTISYTEACHLKKVLKDDVEKIEEALKYLFKKEKENNRPSAQAFEKYLKEAYAYKNANRGQQTNELLEVKKSISLITSKMYDNLDSKNLDKANELLKEIKNRVELFNKLFDK